MAQWHCAIDGRQYGPVDEDVLRSWARQGRLRPTDLVWTDGWGAWAPAATVAGLFDDAPPMPAAGGTCALPHPGGTGGKTSITEIMAQGWRSLHDNWGIALGFSLFSHVPLRDG